MFLVFPRLRLRLSVFALPIMLIMLWCEGWLPFMLLFLSAFAHELGHIIAMRRLKYPPRRIDILPMGALIVCPEGIPHHGELKIALSGPLTSLGLGLFFLVLFQIYPCTFFLFGTVMNFVLGLFNLLPVCKLDGGKALASWLYIKCENAKTAERICSAVSVTFKILFSLIAAAGILLAGFNIGVILLTSVLLFQLIIKGDN